MVPPRPMLRRFLVNSVGSVLLCVVLSAPIALALGPFTTGITATGKIVTTAPGQKAPWEDDVIKMVRPDYPYLERVNHHQGSGIFRVMLDPKTGAVTDVVVKQSTGFAELDNAVLVAARRWRLRPGKWKEFELPVTFVMGRKGY
jgi:TonB family protein